MRAAARGDEVPLLVVDRDDHIDDRGAAGRHRDGRAGGRAGGQGVVMAAAIGVPHQAPWGAPVDQL